jgi:co-chaperonin GroES (HSP10)
MITNVNEPEDKDFLQIVCRPFFAIPLPPAPNFENMHPVSAKNKIIVCFDKKYQDEIVTPSGITFFKDTSYSPEWNVTVTGRVVSVPHKITIPGMTEEVQVGDELAFSYWVIQDKQERPVEDQTFSENTETPSQNKHFTNRLKQTLSVTYINKRQAVGLYLDNFDEWLGGCQGTPAMVESWMVKNFAFTSTQEMIYTNLLLHDNKEYWMVDYTEAIAVKRNGNIIMVGGNVLLEPQVEHMKYEMDAEKHLHLIAKTEYSSSKVVSIGKPLANSPDLNLKSGDKVHFNQAYVQKYTLWGENYLVITQDRILGQS